MTDRPIPDLPHPRAIRSPGGWLVRRLSTGRVRVTSEHGYVDVTLTRGASVSDATDMADYEVAQGRAEWSPVRRGGPSGSASAARAPGSGQVRVEVYLRAPASDSLERLRARHGSNRAAIEWALVQASPPRRWHPTETD